MALSCNFSGKFSLKVVEYQAMLEHLRGEITPEQAKFRLTQLGIEEDSYQTIIKAHPQLDGLSAHELKALVTIACSAVPLGFLETYLQMRDKYPQG